MDILSEIAKTKERTLPSFALAIKRKGIIAEIKKKSPSAGVIKEMDVVLQAKKYERAIAISVLTDTPYFGGSVEDLNRVREEVSLPTLRKDFIITPSQLTEVRSSAILLIVALLQEKTGEMMHLLQELKVDALVEVNNEAELKTALKAGASIIAINHRNLKTFEVDPGLSLRLLPLIPQGVLKVAASGIHSVKEARRFFDAGFDAILVGEALMKSENPNRMIELMKRRLKICGVTDPLIARFAAEAGADYVGLIFHKDSKRYVTLSQAKEVALAARLGGAIPVGVFTDHSKEEILAISEEVGISHIQLHGKTAREAHASLPPQYTRIYVIEVDEKGNYEPPPLLNKERDHLLYDSKSPGQGKSFNKKGFIPHPDYPFFIAGGVTPLNVKGMIQEYDPDGMDVSSGVEIEGKKEKHLIEALIRQC